MRGVEPTKPVSSARADHARANLAIAPAQPRGVFADQLADELARALGRDGVPPVDLRTSVRIVVRESA